MVSYYNPMAMYRQQGPVGPASGQFNSGSPTAGWYSGYHHQSAHMPTPQQYLSCMQDSEAQQMWHHPHGHSVFNHEFFDYNSYIQQQQQHNGAQPTQLHQNRPDSEPQLPSPPMSSSELSSPGAAGGGSVTPPNQGTRPGPVRSPYDWMTKPSYQSQPNPGKTRTKDKYRVVYTDHQRLELEKEFHFSRYITIRRKSELAANLGLSERQVKIWFQNRRAKERKQVKKREELTSKDPLSSPNVAAALSLHQQSLLHHHQVQHQHQQQQQQQQTAAVVSAAVSAVHQQHQSQLGGGGGGHVTVVSVPVPLM